MPLTQVMQGPGRWSIDLDGDRLPVPRAVTDQVPVGTEGFGHIVVTPTRIDPATVSIDTLLQLAVYVGRYLVQRDRTRLSGDHINAWLGDSEGKGFSNNVTADQGFTAWMDVIAIDQAPLYRGITGTPGFTLNWTWDYGQSQREALDLVCRWFGCEWRVRNTFILDADIWTNLYGATPTAIATPWWDGADPEIVGIRATFEPQTSLERYAAVITADGIGGFDSEIDPAWPFNCPPSSISDVVGEFPTRKLLSGGSQMDVSDLATFLAAEGAERWERDPTIKISTDHHCPLSVLDVGDPLYVFDPDADVYDFDNEVHYGGHILWPKILRVQAIVDMPVRAGMGVYFRTAETIVDLTDYVKWETGAARIEVGERVRTMRPSMARKGYDA